MSPTHPGLVVQDSQQVHGIILILLSQRAAVEKQRTFLFSSFPVLVTEQWERFHYLSVVMVRTLVSLQ